MARKVRVFIENVSQHVFLKSLIDLRICRDGEDFNFFIESIKKFSDKHSIDIHSYIIKPNYFEFLATPQSEESLPKFMQTLGRVYVRYYNEKYQRSGTIWEGRYKASLVEDSLILDVMKFIEQQDVLDYPYSSLKKNLYGKNDDIVIYHEQYKKLGFDDKTRLAKYKEIFEQNLEADKFDFIKNSLLKQIPTASKEFIARIQRLIGVELVSKSRGRPSKKENKEKKDKKMYKNLVVLDKEKHKDLKISELKDLSFAKEITFVPLLASEVALVSQAFPVVFTSDENPSIIALISLGGENLALNEENKWITSYVPAYLRKYPFALASTEENPEQKVILIDEDSPLFSKSKGKQLFRKNGEQSETLAHAIKFLTTFENEMALTKAVSKEIAQSGILDDREISVGEGEEKKVLVNGFKVVDREKLNNLSDDVLALWVRKGLIPLIENHINSLKHIETLFKLAMKKQNIA